MPQQVLGVLTLAAWNFYLTAVGFFALWFPCYQWPFVASMTYQARWVVWHSWMLAETPYRANVEFGVCSDDDTVLIHADSSWLHNPSKISKISCLDTAGNLAGFSLAPRCWSHPSLSCYAGYERDWYLSHGEDWAAGAFSTGLCIFLDIADDYDPGLAHVGFLVSREGGMALHGFERLWWFSHTKCLLS